MATPVIMPTLGMTMQEGTLQEWLVADGDRVSKGQPIYRLSTEKIDADVEAEADGILRQLVAPDTTVPTGAVVGCILAEGEALPAEFLEIAQRLMAGPPSATTAQAPATAAPSAVAQAAPSAVGAPASPAARRLARELGVDLAHVTATGPGGRITEEDVRRAAEARPAAATAEVRASPIAKRLAEEHGISLTSITGTGPGGRIVKEDVEKAIAERAAAAAAAPEPSPAAAEVATLPFRGMRRTIAERMHQSLQSMAQLTLTMDSDMTEALKMVSQIREEWRRQGVQITYTDVVIKAVAIALTEHPRLNSVLDADVIRILPQINVGVAVALDEGLIVPVVKDADKKSLREISHDVHELVRKAQSNSLSVDEVSGGTFTITSLSNYDIDIFTPIINPPQAAILGVGRIREVPAFEGDQVVRKSMMYLSLSFDHRLLDGAPAAQFLRRVRNLLERPFLLLF